VDVDVPVFVDVTGFWQSGQTGTYLTLRAKYPHIFETSKAALRKNPSQNAEGQASGVAKRPVISRRKRMTV
jgi:hypothetical protein